MDITVADVRVKVLTITKRIVLQMREIDAQQAIPILREPAGRVLGWVARDAIGARYHYLIVKLGEGEYVRFACLESTADKFPQIFV